MEKINVVFQRWNPESKKLIHEYIPFDYEKELLEENFKAIERYEYCLRQFKKLSDEQRKKGIIYAGLEFDFSIGEVE